MEGFWKEFPEKETPGGILHGTPDKISEGVTERISKRIPETILERTPGGIPKAILSKESYWKDPRSNPRFKKIILD